MTTLCIRTFAVNALLTNFRFQTFYNRNIFLYELYPNESLHKNVCLRTFCNTNLLYEFKLTNLLHPKFFRYKLFAYDFFPIRTFSITNLSFYEPYINPRTDGGLIQQQTGGGG